MDSMSPSQRKNKSIIMYNSTSQIQDFDGTHVY